MTAWLTRVNLNLRHPAVRRDLADTTGMHQRVMAMFPDGLGEQPRQQAGVLYRLELLDEDPNLLVQSAIPSDPQRLPAGYGTAATRDITALLDALQMGKIVHYRLAANPTKRAWSGAKKGKLVALSGAEAEQWWTRRAGEHGLTLQSMTAKPLSTSRTRASAMRHVVTQFDGRAVISDAEQARQAVVAGVGRGRAYGCGLLSVAIAR